MFNLGSDPPQKKSEKVCRSLLIGAVVYSEATAERERTGFPHVEGLRH